MFITNIVVCLQCRNLTTKKNIMKKYLLEFDIYRNDEWQDRESIIWAESEESAINTLMNNTRNLARNIKIKIYE